KFRTYRLSTHGGTGVIEVEHVSKEYSGRKVVDDISFKVEKGEILGFLGPNGAGKTTTMRILTCYMPSTEGTARIAGYDVFEQSLEVRKRIGYLPENPPLYPEMTVDDYLHFVAKIKRTPATARKSQVADAVDRCNLGDVRSRIIGRLSKGYKQRVGLAQALLNNPEVLVLDEPTIGLDPKQINEVRSLIRNLASNHTVILSTHILPEVSMTCNRVIIINNGRMVAMDTPEGLARQLRGNERISITVEGPIDAVREKLSAVDGVENVYSESIEADGTTGTHIVECRMDSDLRRVLASTVVTQGWGLLGLNKISMTLEDVFINLVTREESGN
ncbi:MAG TPA: ATP-binding cassette domain-containing protein, partial [Acidobacteriota bacterium]|nr:ATP-binding cassette domain-containing protein [Acidobacteriota bacterium]